MVDTTSTAGSSGVGQQYPSTSNSDFDVAVFIVRQLMAQLDTMKLVKVTAVTGGGGAVAAAGTVDVELLVNQLDADGNATSSGTVYGIQWYRMQGGKNAVICDPVVGDLGYLVCSDRDISSVKEKKGVANPGSRRKYNVADSIYVGGVLNDVLEQFIRFTDDTIIITDKTGNVIKLSSTGIELTPSGALPVKVNGNVIVTGNLQLGGALQSQTGAVYAGNIVTSGQVTANGIGLTTHHHTQAPDSHGDTEQPTGSAVA